MLAAAGLPFPWYPELVVARPRSGLAAEIRRFDPDVVHVVNPVLFGAWGVATARRLRRPLVASFHTDPKVVHDIGLGLLRKPFEFVDRELHNLAHLSLCTSPQMVDLARNLGIRRVRLWPTGVAGDRFRPERATLAMRRRLSGGEPDKPLLLYVGRLSREKRLGLLAQLEAHRVEHHPRLRKEEKRLVMEVDRLRQARESMLPELPPSALTLYETIRAARHGQAVAKVERGMCQGCRITLPETERRQARSGQSIVQCNSCQRILYAV